MREVKWMTPVPVERSAMTLSHSSRLLLMGSCFTENIGKRLEDSRFVTMVNPFGIVYNPLSIADGLRRCLDGETIGEEHLVLHDGLWHSWLHHGAFSSSGKQQCLEACNASLQKAHRFLQQCDCVLITLGSAWCYALADNPQQIVANCHKVPANRFVKRMATVDEVVTAWEPLLQRLGKQGKQVLFTVSPVRHQAYGAHGNQLGKAVLLLAVQRLMESHGDCCHYFPAYEIVMDELRDYRWYADDLLHPSAMAEEIIWQRFQATYMDEETVKLCETAEKLNRLEDHRPLHSDGGEVARYEANLVALRQELAAGLKQPITDNK
ncbi:MAG: GSCFA domain-containing protein [Bacteroidales bacterium]|nr:GSCFA domain-containing protein [Bacteroidales bacterium]